MQMKEIYFDNASTTRVEPEVIEKINQEIESYANPSSQHNKGKEVREKIENARKKIARSIGAEDEEIIFTSGGTEAINLAIKGLAKANPEKRHIITSSIEHPAVIECCKTLEKDNYKIDYIKTDKEGIVDTEEIRKKINKDTLLVSIMHVNNEIGTIQPIEEIAEICKKKKTYFHTDCVQSYDKIPIDVSRTKIDLLNASGHKIGALKGIGFIYIKLGTKIKPIIDGGGQEFQIRSGTENTTGILSLEKALDTERDKTRVKKIRDYIQDELEKTTDAKTNGSKEKRIYNILNISFYGIEGESLMLLLEKENIFLSTGSACSSSRLEKSHVLDSIGVQDLYIHGSIRISLSHQNTIEEAKYAIEKIKESVNKLEKMSPFKKDEE